MLFIEAGLVRNRHRERLERARQERLARRLVEFARLEKRRERAERALLRVWQRADQIRVTPGFPD